MVRRKEQLGFEDPSKTRVELALDNRDSFDYVCKSAMTSGNTLDVVTVDATGKPGDKDYTAKPVLVLGFVSMTKGGEERSQFSMHVAQFLQIAAALRGRYGE